MVPDINLLPQLEKNNLSQAFYSLVIVIVGLIVAYLLFYFYIQK